LLLGTAPLGHKDQQIALHLRRAREAAIRPNARQKPLLLVRRGRSVMVARGDAVLGKVTFLNAHQALVAGQPTTTDALDLHTKVTRRLQNGGSTRHATTPPGGHEDDEGLGLMAVFSHECVVSKWRLENWRLEIG